MAPPKRPSRTPRTRPCPPPLIRSKKTGRCVPRPSGGIPFGGPASSPWSFGNRGSAAQPAPAPTPIPPTPCTEATVFSDVFPGCMGTIDAGSIGPVCGWVWDLSDGVGGSVSFTPGVMSFNAPLGGGTSADQKIFPVTLTTVNGITGQFTFTEFPASGPGFTGYEISIVSDGQADLFQLMLDNSGSVFVEVGSTGPGNTILYLGTWTPNSGTHTVHFTVDALGAPRLWIDGVEIVLINSGSIFFDPTVANGVTFIMFDFSGNAVSSPVTSVFVTLGALPPETIFCP